MTDSSSGNTNANAPAPAPLGPDKQAQNAPPSPQEIPAVQPPALQPAPAVNPPAGQNASPVSPVVQNPPAGVSAPQNAPANVQFPQPADASRQETVSHETPKEAFVPGQLIAPAPHHAEEDEQGNISYEASEDEAFVPGQLIAPAPEQFEEPQPKNAIRYKCLVNYGKMFQQSWFISFFDTGLKRFAKVVVKTSRGTELGKVILGPQLLPDTENPKTEGRVLRVAVEEDLARAAHIEDHDEVRELEICDHKIEEHGLDMDLVEVEHVLGGEKIIFYFMAEHRVDFRGLVKDLAREFHTRIELRQVGIRDKAKLLSDCEHCGQPLCCRTFLKELAPVGMRMAKTQRTTLDPGKISGCCGRLMCCLRFEENSYRWLVSRMPKRGAIITYQNEQVKVLDLDPMGDRLLVTKEDGTRLTVKRQDTSAADKPEPEQAPPQPTAPVLPEAEEEEVVEAEIMGAAGLVPVPSDEQAQSTDAPKSQDEQKKQGGEHSRRRRHRRRRPRNRDDR
jgi:cell fate regulator YaaT (PSP1 superfamily)